MIKCQFVDVNVLTKLLATLALRTIFRQLLVLAKMHKLYFPFLYPNFLYWLYSFLFFIIACSFPAVYFSLYIIISTILLL